MANASINPASGSGSATVTLRVTATDPQGMPNLAEDQIFALHPGLGRAYILRHARVGTVAASSSELAGRVRELFDEKYGWSDGLVVELEPDRS